MADLKLYTVDIGGHPHTMRLSDEDAKRYGDKAVEVKAAEVKAAEPKNKSRKPANKSATASKK